jgi:hypothetical protein
VVAKGAVSSGDIKVARLKNGRVRATIPVVSVQAPAAPALSTTSGSST